MSWQKFRNAISVSGGGVLRQALDQFWAVIGQDGDSAPPSVQGRVAFTIAIVTLAAKMSKADGVSCPVEAEVFEHLFHVPEKERENLRRIFDQASQDVAGYEIYARQIGDMLADEPELKTSVMETLFQIASADGMLHPAEDHFLEAVAERIGFSRQDFLSVRRAFVHDPDSPYDVLGVSPKASAAEIRSHYLRLVREHHPDGLVAKGVPETCLAAAGQRLAAVNTAYEAILKERGLAPAIAMEPAP
ncbi:MAG: TerB family tellurite resistance protein [Hyphomicrobium sp.]